MTSTVGRVLSTAFLGAAAVVALSMVPEARQAMPRLDQVWQAGQDAWVLLRPGGKWHPAGFIEHRGHLVLEGFLLAAILYLLFQSSSKPGRKARQPLTEREVDELCEEWQPEPLGGPLTEFQKTWVENPLVVTSDVGRTTTVNGKTALDFASMNFLGLAGHPAIRQAAHATIRKYGVGSCGPRGFYGTLDVHLELEARLSQFMGTQETILYSYDLATMPSIIPAFANRKDLIVVDEGCSYAVRNGCHLSRARVITFRHNDVADLERVLLAVAQEDQKLKRPLSRRFVAVEGVYANTGEVAPMAAIAALKTKYKYRLIVDESMALGVLGSNGRGAGDAVGLAPDDVEIIGASLGNALATVGGFCAGDREIVDHQRLSGLGYCFSASLPPYLASAGTAALDIIAEEGQERAAKARANAARLRSAAAGLPGLRVVGGPESAESPLVHVWLDPAPSREQFSAGDMQLQRIAEECLKREGVLVTVAKYSDLEAATRPPPSLRIAVSAAHTPADVDKAVAALKKSAARVLR